MTTPYRVLICDDLPLIRQAVRLTFGETPDFCVVDEAVGGREAVSKAIQLKPDLVLMDVAMPDLDGVEATRRICGGAPELRVLAFSSDAKWETVERMFTAGAAGYVVKGPDLTELVCAARTTMAGGNYLSCALLEQDRPEPCEV